MVAVSLIFVVVLYLQLRIQNHLQLNADGMSSVNAGLAFNTADQLSDQHRLAYYVGESTMSYLSQMAGLAVQNFVSAASHARSGGGHPGILEPQPLKTLGNFWSIVRSLAFILLPIAVVGGSCCVPGHAGHVLGSRSRHAPGRRSDIARGPVASQISIEHLGTNGGTGSSTLTRAAPSESPVSFTGLELFLELLIPFASIFMFGRAITHAARLDDLRGHRRGIGISCWHAVAVAPARRHQPERHRQRAAGETRYGLAETAHDDASHDSIVGRHW